MTRPQASRTCRIPIPRSQRPMADDSSAPRPRTSMIAGACRDMPIFARRLQDWERRREKNERVVANQLDADRRHLDAGYQAIVTKYRWRVAAAAGGGTAQPLVADIVDSQPRREKRKGRTQASGPPCRPC